MRRAIGTILSALGIFGFAYGILDWHKAGRLGGSGGYYYTDETKVIIGLSAVIIFIGILLLKRKRKEK
jgi:uncharacterized membrane protein YidH (DUF202 family)